MNQWRSVLSVIDGSSNSVDRIRGKRVRANARLLSVPVRGVSGAPTTKKDIAAGAVGLVAGMDGFNVIVAIPTASFGPKETLESLARSRAFDAFLVDISTFKRRFDI